MSGIDRLLDTNLVIGILKAYPPAIQAWNASGAAVHSSAISQLTRIELFGYANLTPADEVRTATFVKQLHVIGLDGPVERETIKLRRTTRLKLPDAIIAATAIAHGLDLVTLDAKLAAAFAARRATP